jgi:AraC-like DNA-binding protein
MDAVVRTHSRDGVPAPVSRTSMQYGDMRISRASVTAGGVVLPARPEEASVRIHFIASGVVRYRSQRSANGVAGAVARAGQAVITADPTTLEVTSTSGYSITSIAIPREAVAGLGVDPPDLQEVPPSSPLLDPVATFIGKAALVSDASVTGFSKYYFDRLLHEMVLSLVIETMSAHHVARPAETFSLAMAIIAAQYADPAFSVRGLARELRMSTRQVERAFQERSTTVTREVRSARLEQAAAMLRDAAYRALTIDEIGRYVGFSGGSSLARAMMRAGRPSPAELRGRG